MKTESSSSFAVLSVGGVPRSLEDELTSLFFELGAAGVSEDLPFFQQDLRYDPEIQEAANLSLSVYFSHVPSEQERLDWVEQVRGCAPDARVTFRIEAERDWLEEWKKGFKPFQFAEPFWVVPRWIDIPEFLRKRPQHVLLMEPGMAFGTGTHETTRLAAGFIVEAVTPGMRVLDVGTGTGILALIAERLGAREIVGNDIDPEARRTARENLELNRSEYVRIDDRDLAAISSDQTATPFDLVIANIIDGVLLTLADDLSRAVRPGGVLVLSGILTDREDQFHREFASKTGFIETARRREGEWCASMWRKSGE